MSGNTLSARALILRGPVEAAPYVEALGSLGMAGQACPLTKTVWLDEGQAALRPAVAALPDNSGVFLASQASVAALVEAAKDAGLADPVPQWHAVVAGPATFVTLRQACASAPALARRVASLAIAAIDRDGTIGAAAAAMFAARGVKHVLVPRARHGRRDVFAALAALRLPFTEIDCYETVNAVAPEAQPLLAELAKGRIAYVVAMAPSSVAALQAAMHEAAGIARLDALPCRWLALGDTTRTALLAAGIPPGRVATAAEPSPQGIAQAVANWA